MDLTFEIGAKDFSKIHGTWENVDKKFDLRSF